MNVAPDPVSAIPAPIIIAGSGVATSPTTSACLHPVRRLRMVRFAVKVASFLAGLAVLAGVLVYCGGLQLAIAHLTKDHGHLLPGAAASASDGVRDAGPVRLTVVTFNVLLGSSFIESWLPPLLLGDKRDYGPWSTRSPLIKARLASYHADLIGLQEVGSDADLARVMPSRDYTLVSYHKGPVEYGDAALLFRTRRFDLLDSGQFWLGPNPDMPMAFGFRRLSMLRYANWALLREKETHFKFIFFNTHFDGNRQNKESSADLFFARVSSLPKDLAVVVTGDFNTRSAAGRYSRLTGARYGPKALLVDAYNLAGQPGVAREQGRFNQIDHILAGGGCKVTANAWRVDKSLTANGKTLSDHDPIISELVFTPPGAPHPYQVK